MRGTSMQIPYHCPRCGSDASNLKFSTLSALRRHVADVHLRDNLTALRVKLGSDPNETFLSSETRVNQRKQQQSNHHIEFIQNDSSPQNHNHKDLFSQGQTFYAVTKSNDDDFTNQMSLINHDKDRAYQTPLMNHATASSSGAISSNKKLMQSFTNHTYNRIEDYNQMRGIHRINPDQLNEFGFARLYSSSMRRKVVGPTPSKNSVENILQESRTQLDAIRRSADRDTVFQNEKV